MISKYHGVRIDSTELRAEKFNEWKPLQFRDDIMNITGSRWARPQKL